VLVYGGFFAGKREREREPGDRVEGRGQRKKEQAARGGRGSGTYDEVAGEDLEQLSLEAGAAGEDALEDADQHVAERRADQRAVDGHLGHARREVVPVLVAVLRDPRRQDLLEPGEGARGQHLGAQRVGLQLEEVGLEKARMVMLVR